MSIFLDFETRSKIDIFEAGAWAYAAHPSTEILCMAYCIGDGVVSVITREQFLDFNPERDFPELWGNIHDGEILCAHNAFFEASIWYNIMVPKYGAPRIPIKQWRCTAAKAASRSLPRALGNVAKVLNTVTKDPVGKRIMMKMCKPLPNGGWHENEDDFQQLYAYCINDVLVEREVDHVLPDLIPSEQTIWFLDQLINQRGIQIDREAVGKALQFIERHTHALNDSVFHTSEGVLDGVTRRMAVLDWVKDQGVEISGYAKADVSKALEQKDIPDAVRTVLEAKLQLGKTSTAKYTALNNSSLGDGRIRDTLMYHGANTGRWCMPGEAEVLTPNGWVRLDQWSTRCILIWYPPVNQGNLGHFSWDEVAGLNHFDYEGPIVKLDHRFLKGIFTPEHRFPTKDLEGVFRNKEAQTLVSRDSLFVSGIKNKSSIDEIQTRLWVMLQADGYVCEDKSSGRMVRFHFKKIHKIQRAQELLAEAGIPFILREYKCGTQIKIRWIDAPEWFKIKHFNPSLLNHNAKVFIKEVSFWNSSIDRRNQTRGFEFSSTCLADAEWVATMAHLAGFAATINLRKRQNTNWSASYRVLIREASTLNLRGPNISSQKYTGKVFCPTTASGYFLCRYNGLIFVSGNSGKLVQLQNLPKGNVKDTDQAVQALKEMSYEDFSVFYPDVMGTLSSCIRGMIVAKPGYDLLVADYAAIEARVVAWLANDERCLKQFRNNEDLYVEMAKVIYNCTEVSKQQRQLGKAAILGCSYGMGHAKFAATCSSWGIPITPELAQKTVETYRATYPGIKNYWYATERAAIECVKTKQAQTVGRTRWEMDSLALVHRLPSGRSIVYNDATIDYVETSWGERKLALQFMSVDARNQWSKETTYGSRLVENCTQAVARDLLAYAMLRLEQKSYPVIFSVHDEIVSEVPEAFGSVEEYEKIMCDNPKWAEGCPIAAEGFRCKRYKK